MASEPKKPKKITVKKSEKTFAEDFKYEPAPETEMDFRTEEDEKKRKRNITIGALLGILLAAALIGGFVYHVQKGRIGDADVTVTVSTSRATTRPGSLEPSNTSTTRHYVTRQLTVHKDENGVWRSYAGLEKTVGYTGVVGNDTGWWYVENDVVNFKFNGIADNDYGSWIIENGKVNLDYTGEYVYNGRLYYIRKGKVVKSEKMTTTTTTATTATTTTTTATTTTTEAPTETTTEHDHHWVAVYDGNAIFRQGTSRTAVKCLDCGLLFANAELLEAHAHALNHEVKYQENGYGLEEDHILSKDEVGDKEVIIGYENEENTYWVCTICGASTSSADEADADLR